MRRPLAALLLVGLGACADHGSRGPSSEPVWPGLTLDLTTDVERPALEVEVRLSGDRAAGVTELHVARAWAGTSGADAFQELRVRDGAGDVAARALPDDEGPDWILALDRAPTGGELWIRYRAPAQDGSRFAVRVDQDRATGVGHAFLLLPRLGASIPARVRWHLRGMRPGSEGASSFGDGDPVVTEATSEELASAAYAAGRIRIERGDRARLMVLGNPAFDTRTALELAGSVEAATARLFAPSALPEAPLSFLVVGEPRLGQAYDGAFLGRSVALWFDKDRPLDAEMKLVLAHEVSHRFLGGRLRLVQADGRDCTWFSEGFAVHFARRVLLGAGLITRADFLVDLRRTLDDAAADRGPAPEESPHSPAVYRRGAQLAAYLDAAVRRRSRGERSLDDVLRELVAKAARAPSGRLPLAALREALERAAGREVGAELIRLADPRGPAIEVPSDAFGPCFQRTAKETPVFELGFDPASLRGMPALIRGLVPGSAAERAGVKEGALVISSRLPDPAAALARGSRAAEVELTLAERSGGRRVRYHPVGIKKSGTWELRSCAER